jgi:hypothetical protein
MKTHLPIQPEGDETDDRLRRRITRTSPQFEARFQELKLRLASEPVQRRQPVLLRFPVPARRVLLAMGSIAAVLAATVVLVFQPGRTGPATPSGAPAPVPVFAIEDPFTLEQSLAPALVLLDEEIIQALLHLPHENNT